MHSSLSRVDHRPWPLPRRPWRWRQTWHDLLFAHWPVETAKLRHLVPAWLTIQEFGGSSWVGLVPFWMSGVTFRHMPSIPWLSRFPEMNLRLYVEHQGRAGVYFVSLDASRWAAVWGARTFAHLPYFLADMRVTATTRDIRYNCVRRSKDGVKLVATYGPTGPVFETAPGTVEHFLTERYCLYTEDRLGRPRRLDIHHHPWPIQPAEADFEVNEVAAPQGIDLPRGVTPLLHFSRRLDVIGWNPERI